MQNAKFLNTKVLTMYYTAKECNATYFVLGRLSSVKSHRLPYGIHDENTPKIKA